MKKLAKVLGLGIIAGLLLSSCAGAPAPAKPAAETKAASVQKEAEVKAAGAETMVANPIQENFDSWQGGMYLSKGSNLEGYDTPATIEGRKAVRIAAQSASQYGSTGAEVQLSLKNPSDFSNESFVLSFKYFIPKADVVPTGIQFSIYDTKNGYKCIYSKVESKLVLDAWTDFTMPVSKAFIDYDGFGGVNLWRGDAVRLQIITAEPKQTVNMYIDDMVISGTGGALAQEAPKPVVIKPYTLPTPKPDPKESMDIFLLIGQSNMAGIPTAEAQDLVANPNVRVLGFDNYASPARAYCEWAPAVPPLAFNWTGVGPGDYFAKTLAKAKPNAIIGLVPLAIPGADIDMFRKGVVSSRRSEFTIPPNNGWKGAYEWMIERAKFAQNYGTIRGIIFHQGESDNGNTAWLYKVAGMVKDLKSDLKLGDIPFLVGETLYKEAGGACYAHNEVINQITKFIPNSYVISAKGLSGQDQYHFDLAGVREFGIRYGTKMLEVLKW